MDLIKSSEFKLRVEELMEQHHVPGLTIATVHSEKVTSAGYGMASLTPPKPCTADTLFDIASASKSFTAASVGILVADKEKYPEILWEASMSSLLPEDFVMPGDGYTEGVTVEDILSHRSGMAFHDYSYMSPRAARPDDPRSVTRNLRNLPVGAPIRSRFMYCNMMYTVATHLVEQKSKLSFSDFLEELIFRPLDMTDTSLQAERAQAKGFGDRIAMGHSWNAKTGQFLAFPSLDCPEAQGAGSIITNVTDYIKWVKAMLNREGPLTDEIYEGLVKLRAIQDSDPTKLRPFISPSLYAAGLDVLHYRGHLIIGHDGMTSGFATHYFFLPDLKFGAVLFGNSNSADVVAHILAFELIDEFLMIPLRDRSDWKKIECGPSPGDDGYSSAHEEEKKGLQTLRQQLCPGIKEDQLQQLPLSAYTGEYWNPGYHNMTVQIRENKLFIDASDRSTGSLLTFDHVCDQTKYIVRLSDFQAGGCELLKAEFTLEQGKATKMGLYLEPQVGEYIWFDKV